MDFHISRLHCTLAISTLILLTFDLLLLDWHKQRAILRAHLLVLAHRSRLVHLALHTVLELVTPSGARGTLLAVLAGVAALLRRLAHTLATHALSVARADLASRWVRAGLVGCQAVARGPSPLAVAHTRPAIARAMVWARAQQTVVAIAREVVALTELARNHLRGIRSFVAVTDAAQAVATSTAVRGGRVVRPASQVTVRLTIYVQTGGLNERNSRKL